MLCIGKILQKKQTAKLRNRYSMFYKLESRERKGKESVIYQKWRIIDNLDK